MPTLQSEQFIYITSKLLKEGTSRKILIYELDKNVIRILI